MSFYNFFTEILFFLFLISLNSSVLGFISLNEDDHDVFFFISSSFPSSLLSFLAFDHIQLKSTTCPLARASLKTIFKWSKSLFYFMDGRIFIKFLCSDAAAFKTEFFLFHPSWYLWLIKPKIWILLHELTWFHSFFSILDNLAG